MDGPADEGAQFGKYRVVRKLGSGAFGSVYEAVLPGPMGFSKPVALKMIPPALARDERFVQAMVNEARIGGQLHNDHIVDVLEFDQVEGRYYLAMEFVDGLTLSEIIRLCRSRGVLLPRFALVSLAVDVARGLSYAHRLSGPDDEPLDLVHRDLKPSNIMVTAEGTAKILDFGIAKAASNLYKTTQSSVSKGTPRYMSPEQMACEGPLTHKSDLFSLGVVLFELVTGEALFEAENLPGLWLKITTEDITGKLARADEALPGIGAVLERSLERDPVRRYDDARALLADLRELERRHPRDADMEEVMEVLLQDRPPGPAVLGSGDLEVGVAVLDAPPTLEASPSPVVSIPPEGDSGWTLFHKRYNDDPTVAAGFARGQETRSAVQASSDAESVSIPGLAGLPTEAIALPRGTTSPPPGPAPKVKRVVWYLTTLPMALALWPPLALVKPTAVLSALGLSTDLPAWLGSAIASVLILGLVIDVWLLDRYWSRGKPNLWLHTDAFVIFPAAGLGFILFHYLVWKGKTAAHQLTLHSYSPVSESQAEHMMALLQESNSGFLNAVAIDVLIVGATYILVVLGYVFLPRSGGGRTGHPARWLIIPAGMVVVEAVEGWIFPDLMRFMGWMHLTAYATWTLVAVAMLRLDSASQPGGVKAWRVLLVGVSATLATVAFHLVMAHVQALQMFIKLSPGVVPAGTMAQLYGENVHASMWRGTLVELSLLLLLFVALAVLVRQHLPWKGSPRSAVVAVVTMLLIGATIPITIGAMANAGDQWLVLTFTDMIPVEAPDGSVYIDVRPTALSEGRRGLCASLSEGDRLDLLIEGCVDEVLVAALAEGESCAPVLVQTLNDPEVAARCVTGAEARLYCEAQGKRLPTPVEWAAAEAVLEVDSLGEWVMAEVHGTPAFEVVVPDGVSGVPAQLDVDEGSDRVGFRCAYSF